MSDEEIATASMAAELSRHFAGAMPTPAGGIIATTAGFAEFTNRADFEKALVGEAAKGIAAADSETEEEITPLEKARVSSYAAKLERKRRAAAKKAEHEEEEERSRAAFIQKAREEARARVLELREAQETASAVDRALAASRKAMDPEAAHRRPLVVLGLKHWG